MINGSYKAEAIHRSGPWKAYETVEFAMLQLVDWFNHRRMLASTSNVPPDEEEEHYYANLDKHSVAA